MLGNYVLMSFYTCVTGWMLYYFYRSLAGQLEGMDTDQVAEAFSGMLSQPVTMGFWMVVVVVLGFLICSMGLQKGVERITKWMMLALLALIVVLAVNSVMLPGGMEGVKFYLVPDFSVMAGETALETVQNTLGVVTAALNQSFFTLSLGIGAHADLRQLSGPPAQPAGRERAHRRAGHLRGLHLRPHHLSGLHGLRRARRQRPQPHLHHPAQRLQRHALPAGCGAACSFCS